MHKKVLCWRERSPSQRSAVSSVLFNISWYDTLCLEIRKFC